MSFAFSASTREVLEQVVRDPGFRDLTRIPLIAPVRIIVIAGAYATFFCFDLLLAARATAIVGDDRH